MHQERLSSEDAGEAASMEDTLYQLIEAVPPGRLPEAVYCLRGMLADDEGSFFSLVPRLCLRHHLRSCSLFPLPCNQLPELTSSATAKAAAADNTSSALSPSCVNVLCCEQTHLMTWMLRRLCGATWGMECASSTATATATASGIEEALQHLFREQRSLYVADDYDSLAFSSRGGDADVVIERNQAGEEMVSSLYGGADDDGDLLGSLVPSYGVENVCSVFVDLQRRLYVEVDPIECRCIRAIRFFAVSTQETQEEAGTEAEHTPEYSVQIRSLLRELEAQSATSAPTHQGSSIEAYVALANRLRETLSSLVEAKHREELRQRPNRHDASGERSAPYICSRTATTGGSGNNASGRHQESNTAYVVQGVSQRALEVEHAISIILSPGTSCYPQQGGAGAEEGGGCEGGVMELHIAMAFHYTSLGHGWRAIWRSVYMVACPTQTAPSSSSLPTAPVNATLRGKTFVDILHDDRAAATKRMEAEDNESERASLMDGMDPFMGTLLRHTLHRPCGPVVLTHAVDHVADLCDQIVSIIATHEGEVGTALVESSNTVQRRREISSLRLRLPISGLLFDVYRADAGLLSSSPVLL